MADADESLEESLDEDSDCNATSVSGKMRIYCSRGLKPLSYLLLFARVAQEVSAITITRKRD